MNTMDYAHLGRSGLLVSRIGPGTMNSGDATPEADAHRILDPAVDLGVSFIGSADVYGGPQSPDMAQDYGTSEEIVASGKISYVGSSSFAGWDVTDSHLTGHARVIEQELIPALEHFRIGLIPWSPLAMGCARRTPRRRQNSTGIWPGLGTAPQSYAW